MLIEKNYIFFVAATEKKPPEALFFQQPQYKRGIFVADTEWCTILEDFMMKKLKSDWFNLKILMSVWYRKMTLPCVSFTICQQCHEDIEGDITPISLKYRNIHWQKQWSLTEGCRDKPGVEEVVQRKEYFCDAKW